MPRSSAGESPGFTSTSIPWFVKIATAACDNLSLIKTFGMGLLRGQGFVITRSLCCRPIEPGQQRLDVGSLDRRTTPDTQTGGCVAIVRDVERHALLLQQRCQFLRSSRLRIRRKGREPRRVDDQANRRPRPASWIGSKKRRPGALLDPRSNSGKVRPATAHQSLQPADRLRPAQAIERIFHAQHRRRVDGLACKNPVDQLAALGEPENLRAAATPAYSFPSGQQRAATAQSSHVPPLRPAPSARTRSPHRACRTADPPRTRPKSHRTARALRGRPG